MNPVPNKFCNLCGLQIVRREWKFNFNTKTGQPQNNAWEERCPNEKTLYADTEFPMGNGHYYNTGDDLWWGLPDWTGLAILMGIFFIILIWWIIHP